MTIHDKLTAILEARRLRVSAMDAEAAAINNLYNKMSPTDKIIESGQFVRDLDPETHIIYARNGDDPLTFKELEAS